MPSHAPRPSRPHRAARPRLRFCPHCFLHVGQHGHRWLCSGCWRDAKLRRRHRPCNRRGNRSWRPDAEVASPAQQRLLPSERVARVAELEARVRAGESLFCHLERELVEDELTPPQRAETEAAQALLRRQLGRGRRHVA